MPSFLPLRSRSRPTTPNSRTRASSPQPLQRNQLSASLPNVPAAARYPEFQDAHQPLPEPLEIRLNNDKAILRGTGSETEPALLSGVVQLRLPAATDIKEVGLVLKAKARINPPNIDGNSKGQTHTTLVFTHSWDFLEGDKSHPHTLKAGVHEWPFQLELNSAIPSSIFANGGNAVIAYKLRATAIRPAFATNYTTSREFSVIRSFSQQALEYQQTLEIENLWPDKVMYRVVLPHKAWAAGDTLSALLKFTPLAKGVRILSVKMEIQEKVKTSWRSITHENIRIIAAAKQSGHRGRIIRAASPLPVEPVRHVVNNDRLAPPSFFRRMGSRVASRENLRSIFRIGTSGRSTPSTPASGLSPPESSSETSSSRSRSSGDSSVDQQTEDDIEIIVRLKIPENATPSHPVWPIIVSHRVKWDVLIANLDGHHSELRCSLPIHLLDAAVLDESRGASSITRNLLFGEDLESFPVQESFLPAYSDHVRDRVANANLHTAILAENPLTNESHLPEDDIPTSYVLSSSYGPSSSNVQPRTATVPRIASVPEASERNRMYPSELAVSLGNIGSVLQSRQPSRAPSPEQREEPQPETSTSGRNSRTGKFSLRPFTPFASSRNKSLSNLTASRSSISNSNPLSRTTTRSTTMSGDLYRGHRSNMSSTTNISVNSERRNIYDLVPDYSMAAAGFLGGGITPLSALRGLPSYSETPRSMSPTSTRASGAVSQTQSSRSLF